MQIEKSKPAMRSRKAGLLIIGFLIVASHFLYQHIRKISLPLPDYQPLSHDAAQINCDRRLTGFISGENNPHLQDLSAQIYKQSNNSFTLMHHKGELIFKGFATIISQRDTQWTVISNTNKQLVAYLLISSETSSVDEYVTLFIDKQSGHGIISGNRMDIFVNPQVKGYTTYITCVEVLD